MKFLRIFRTFARCLENILQFRDVWGTVGMEIEREIRKKKYGEMFAKAA